MHKRMQTLFCIQPATVSFRLVSVYRSLLVNFTATTFSILMFELKHTTKREREREREREGEGQGWKCGIRGKWGAEKGSHASSVSQVPIGISFLPRVYEAVEHSVIRRT